MEGFQFSFDAHPPILSRITVANLLVVQTHLGYRPRRCGTSKSAAWQQKPINSLWFCRRSLSKGSVEWKWKNRYLYYNDFTPYSTSILHMMSHNSANMWFVSPLAYFDVMQKNGMCQNRLNRNGLRANGGCNMLQHVLSSLWSKTCSKNNNNLPSSRLFYFSVRPTPPKTSGLRTSIFALRAIYFVSFLICRSIPSVSVVMSLSASLVSLPTESTQWLEVVSQWRTLLLLLSMPIAAAHRHDMQSLVSWDLGTATQWSTVCSMVLWCIIVFPNVLWCIIIVFLNKI